MPSREATPAELDRLAARPDYYHYIGDIRRIGVRSFATYMEHEHFPPLDPALNDKFNLSKIVWPPDAPMIHIVISIPHRYKAHAEAMMKRLGLRAADGIPTVLNPSQIKDVGAIFVGAPNRINSRAAGVQIFPHFNTKRCFTLENVAGHFAYQNNPALGKTAREMEDMACDAKIAEGQARWRAVHGNKRHL